MKFLKSILAILLITAMTGTMSSCKKEEQPKPTSTPLSITSISAASTTIPIGGTTKITVTAVGDGLTYIWSASAGDIIGNGSQITYGASGCCAGQNSVTCVVKDSGGNQKSISTTITVQ